MSLRKLPKVAGPVRPRNYQPEIPGNVLSRWADQPMAADSDSDTTITIFDVIGEDWWSGGGFTAKRMSNALRKIGNQEVTVQINSPGGDLFEGLAIYNLLAKHPAKVTVEVMGWAASAASIIAMAGDEIRMGLGTFMMVHNAWGLVIGNRHEMAEASELFGQFDSAIADIYEARTGEKRAEIERLMDAETFMGPSEAVKHGFADAIDDSLESKSIEPDNEFDRAVMARRKIEGALAKAGFTRTDRSEILADLGSTGPGQRDATRQEALRDASFDVDAARKLLADLNH